MRYLVLYLLGYFMLMFSASSMQATELLVHLQGGSQYSSSVDEIDNIVYNPSTYALEINLESGVFQNFYLSEIRKITFEEQLEGLPEKPIAYSLLRNHPNPFNSTTTIEYQLPVSSEVQVLIYNIQGQLVRRLADDFLQAGVQRFSWDGATDSGTKVASGIYICCIRRGTNQLFHRMLLLK